MDNIDQGKPLKIAISPTTEKYAATPDTANAENNNPIMSVKLLVSILIPQNLSKS